MYHFKHRDVCIVKICSTSKLIRIPMLLIY